MSTTFQLGLSSTASGRILLHLLALRRDHRWSWHVAGIVREIGNL